MARRLPDDVAAIMRALLERLDELVQQVGDEVWRSVAGYQDTLADKHDLEVVVRSSLQAVLAATAELRPIDADDLAASERVGETRALQGMGATSMVQSYRAAERCLVESFLTLAGELDGTRCAHGIRALTEALDRLERAAVLAHQRTEQAVALAHENTIAALLTQLASGVVIDQEALRLQAASVNLDPDRSYVGAAVVVPTDLHVDRMARLRRQLARRVAELGRGSLPSALWHGLILLLVPTEPDDAALPRLLASQAQASPIGGALIVGLGEPAAALAGAGLSLRQAASAARLGAERGQLGELVRYASVALDVLLSANPETARVIVDDVLGPLLGRPQLLATLRAYLAADASNARAATALGVHVNTVAYRVRQIGEHCGVDMRSVGDLARLDVALRATDLLHVGPPPAGGGG